MFGMKRRVPGHQIGAAAAKSDAVKQSIDELGIAVLATLHQAMRKGFKAYLLAFPALVYAGFHFHLFTPS